MKYAYTNGTILTAHLQDNHQMVQLTSKTLVVEDEKIVDITDTIPQDCTIIDLQNSYLLPGLINAHVHLCPSSKPKKNSKPIDYNKLAKRINQMPVILKVLESMQKRFVKEQLYSGVTTIRTVGGIQDTDSKIRDLINQKKIIGPRVLTSNMAISVPGGHFAGLLATQTQSAAQVLDDLQKIVETKPDWIKLMVTGGVLDAKKMGEPGELKMDPKIIKAACSQAHKLGYKVAAHVESQEGVFQALKNGVDTIEHGAKPNDEIIALFKKNKAAQICTISPALPFAKSKLFEDCYGEVGKVNGKIVLDGIVECAKACIENDIPVGIGTDTGCPNVTQYDTWRELVYFKEYCDVSNDFAIYTATLQNAKILGIDSFTGSIDIGKDADFIVVKDNPLTDLTSLRNIEYVSYKGCLHVHPKIKKNKDIEKELDSYL